jgi:nitrous oxide reductase accessory protein NosL
MDFNKDTTCLVRHLKVYKNPQWVAKIELKNGKKIFFSSPKSMFEFYFRPGKWFDMGVKSEDDFKDILVTDFKTLKPINARGAFYIYGANVISPGGDDLIPFASYEDAQEFSKKHNGKRILSFKEVSDALIRLINGRI